MAILKCKMCGGSIELMAEKTFGTCEYCGSTMTFPKIKDEQRTAAFNRGNHFRRIGDFDKALAVYESIIKEDNTDAEAHWCCALCRFGIEYVEDPATYEWLPTCHRLSIDSFIDDVDYLAAVEYSEGITRRQYQKDGAKIVEVQKDILSISQNTENYEVFICYKETDQKGNRTIDSTLAQDIYYRLVEQGRKVFFARISLEEITGNQYEPYIFAALNSAKVMIVIGTKEEYLNAVWVKNEWSRFLSLMKKDNKKTLLPCYRDMDPYDLPEQLSILQSYDMAKIGFIQDLIRGISKILDVDKQRDAEKKANCIQQVNGENIIALMERGYMALEDKQWEKADEFFEKVLNQDARFAEAYVGKLCAQKRCVSMDKIGELVCDNIKDLSDYKKAIRFGDIELVERLNRNVQKAENLFALKREKEAIERQRRKEKQEQEARQQEENRRIKELAHKTMLEEKERELEVKRQKNRRLNGMIAISSFAMAAVKKDGTVEVVAQNASFVEEIKKWNNIIAVCMVGNENTFTKAIVGLKADGTLVVTGNAKGIIKEIKEWKDIISISGGDSHLVGLKADGTVVSTTPKGLLSNYKQHLVGEWKNVVQIVASLMNTFGLTSDGKVLVSGSCSQERKDSISKLCDIVHIDSDMSDLFAMNKKGTVKVVKNLNARTETVHTILAEKEYNNISVTAAYPVCCVLKMDGTVDVNYLGEAILKSDYADIESNVSAWNDIIALSGASYGRIMGITIEGRIIQAGKISYNGDFYNWKIFD